MPKRTNEFQELVALVQRVMSPMGAKVVESAMVSVPGLKGLREIDVLVEAPFGAHRIKMAVEAKDHKRPLDLTGVEQIIAKYRGQSSVLVDKVVIVTHNGYSEDAEARAAACGIETLTLSEANPVSIKNAMKLSPKGSLKFEIAPHVANIELDPCPKVESIEDLLQNGHLFCKCHDRDHGTVKKFADHVAFCHIMKQGDFMQQLNSRLQAGGHICAKIGSWCLHKFTLHYKGQKFDPGVMSFHIHAAAETGELTFKPWTISGGSVGSRTMQHGSATVGGKKFEMVLPDQEQGSIAIRIGDACTDDG